MISKKSLLITVLSLIGAAILAIWLYITFHILFIFLFIPLAFVGPFFRRREHKGDYNWGEKTPPNNEEYDKTHKRLLPKKPPSLPENMEQNDED